MADSSGVFRINPLQGWQREAILKRVNLRLPSVADDTHALDEEHRRSGTRARVEESGARRAQ